MSATATYQLDTSIGVVRLLIPDNADLTNTIFSDDEITAFLTLEDQNVRLAAAQALDTIAASETLTLKAISLLDLTTNGPAVSKELRARADSLRQQVKDGEGDDDDLFAIVENPVDTFSRRDWWRNEWRREAV